MDKYELAELIEEGVPLNSNSLDVIEALHYIMDDYISAMQFDIQNEELNEERQNNGD